MADSNKIVFGLEKVYYAVCTIGANNSATYGTPVALPGAVSLSLSPQGDTTPFYADDIEYYTSVNNNGYEGDLTLAKVPDSFWKDCLGYGEDPNGILYENADAPAVHFALLFEFKGDAHAKRVVLYNCVATRPNIDRNTKEENVTPQTEQVSIKCTSIYNTNINTNIVKACALSSGSAASAYASWYSTVYVVDGAVSA